MEIFEDNYEERQYYINGIPVSLPSLNPKEFIFISQLLNWDWSYQLDNSSGMLMLTPYTMNADDGCLAELDNIRGFFNFDADQVLESLNSKQYVRKEYLDFKVCVAFNYSALSALYNSYLSPIIHNYLE